MKKLFAVWVNNKLLASEDWNTLKGAASAAVGPFGDVLPSTKKRPKDELRREAQEKDGRLVIL